MTTSILNCRNKTSFIKDKGIHLMPQRYLRVQRENFSQTSAKAKDSQHCVGHHPWLKTQTFLEYDYFQQVL